VKWLTSQVENSKISAEREVILKIVLKGWTIRTGSAFLFFQAKSAVVFILSVLILTLLLDGKHGAKFDLRNGCAVRK
jgi:hypothetical protein